MKRVVTIVVLLAMLLTCFPAVTFATNATNTLNGEEIPFSQWTNAAFGGWEQLEDGTLVPTELTDFTMLRLEQDLGEEYTIEFDVKQEDNTSGWNTIQIGFEVNEGENFTQSGFLLDMHNFGVARVIEFSKANSGAGVLGSYDNPYGGTVEFSKTTEWIHIKVRRDGAGFVITINDGTEKTITFLTENFSGGHFVIGAVGNRMVSYKNIQIITGNQEKPEPDPEPTVGTDFLNGEPIDFSQWTNAAFGGWEQNEEGVFVPTELTDFTMLRLEQDLGDKYTIEFDVKQEDNTSGWNTIQIGFEVNEGENFTQSGFLLDMHNFGVARVIEFSKANSGAEVLGSYDNPYGGTIEFSKTTEWIHIKVQRDGAGFTITINDGTEKVITFLTENFSGGHFVLGAVGNRMVTYKNINITTGDAPVVDPGTDPEPTPAVGTDTYNGEPFAFSEWTSAGFGGWQQLEDGTIVPTELTDYTLLRLEKNLGNVYTVELDVKQEDNTSGWNTIQIGFDVKEGENLTLSGLTLDMHNAGVARVINYGSANMGASKPGSYDNPYGGNVEFSATTEWIHVKIQRNGSDFIITFNDGTEKTITFTTDEYNGGYLVLGAVGTRMVSYKNIVIDCAEVYVEIEEDPRAIQEETEPGVNTYHGEPITIDDWSALGDSEWVEENGIYYTKDMVEYSMLTLNKPLGETYTIELDVRQNQVSTGWNTIMIGFDVNEGENLSTSGLTLDMHNAGVWRIIDFKDRDNKNVAIGNYSNPYGGERWDYSCTTQWIHVRIERLKNYYSVTINDGTEKTIRFETDAYNGGHLCISAVGRRDIMFKNITILDHVTSLAASEPTYPETIGSTAYTFDGNAYGEWIAPEGWKAEGSSFTSTITEGEQTAYLNVATMRNFKLTLDYEVLSENGGTFGIGFRKKTGAGTYQGLGYALIFKLDPEGNTMTIADYTASGAAGLDGMAHEFELAGNVTLTASGNEFCVWLDDELILNVTSNAYAFGHISLFTDGCSVEFANIEVTSDALLPDIVWDVLEAINANQEITPEMAAQFDQISEFEKSMVPANVIAKVEAAQQQTSSDSGAWIYVAIGCGVAVVAAVVILLVLKKKKAKK